ncbi:hypothetical protein T4D_16440 [Trichinella pseudospiralis]|uniref:Uncharacterized protein n=1 Tax=Trichinella pseudospiralis TaxID=6337 RepID=A0A0V1FZ23_TRIPS|nr:hypothetical protein T4D_16440 [Trichinella pseudospiralis]
MPKSERQLGLIVIGHLSQITSLSTNWNSGGMFSGNGAKNGAFQERITAQSICTVHASTDFAGGIQA